LAAPPRAIRSPLPGVDEAVGRARGTYAADNAADARARYASDLTDASRDADSVRDARKRLITDALDSGDLGGATARLAPGESGAPSLAGRLRGMDPTSIDSLVNIDNSTIGGSVNIDNSIVIDNSTTNIFGDRGSRSHRDLRHPYYYAGLGLYLSFGSRFALASFGYGLPYDDFYYYSFYHRYRSPFYHYYHYAYYPYSYVGARYAYGLPNYYAYSTYCPPYYYGGSWYYTPRSYYSRRHYYRHAPRSFYFFVNLGDYETRNVPESYVVYQASAYPEREEVYVFQDEDSASRAYAAFALKNYYRSIVDFSEAIRDRPDDGLIYFARAQSYFAIADYRSAYYDILAGMEMIPDWPSIRINLSEIYTDLDEFTGQLEALQSWAERHPKDYQAHFVLGYMYYFLQQYDLAKFELVYALAGSEGQPQAERLLQEIYEIEAAAAAAAAEMPAAAEPARPEPTPPPMGR
jgi:hypothetical protein